MCNKKQKLPQTSSQHSTTWNLSLERHQQWHLPAKRKTPQQWWSRRGNGGETASKIDSQLTSTKVLKWISFRKFSLFFIYFSLWHFFIACGAKSSPATRDKFSQQAFHRDKSHLRDRCKKPVAWATRKSELERGWKLRNFARLLGLENRRENFSWLPPP